MYRILSTNSGTLKDRKIQFKEGEISVAVLESDIKNLVSEPKLYAFRWGQIYDPENDFKPNIEGNQRIKGQLVEDYFKQKDAARVAYEKMLDEERAKGTSLNSSQEVETLKSMLQKKEERVKEQAARIAELTKNSTSPSTSQADRLEALIEMQTAALKQVNEMKPREIVIKNELNGKTSRTQAKIIHEEFETVLSFIANDHAVFLSGPAGTGKSHLAKQIADALELDFHAESAISQEYKLTGFIDANGRFNETPFYKAFKNGGLFCIDEIDASHPDVLVILNTAIEQGYFAFPNGQIDAHKDFRIIAAGNTSGGGADSQYTGRHQLDASTLDRFFEIKITYMKDIEMSITNNNAELVEFARSMRNAAESTGIMILFSYRSLGRISSMENQIDLIKLLKVALIKGLAADDVRILSRNMLIDSNNKYFKALKEAA